MTTPQAIYVTGFFTLLVWLWFFPVFYISEPKGKWAVVHASLGAAIVAVTLVSLVILCALGFVWTLRL